MDNRKKVIVVTACAFHKRAFCATIFPVATLGLGTMCSTLQQALKVHTKIDQGFLFRCLTGNFGCNWSDRTREWYYDWHHSGWVSRLSNLHRNALRGDCTHVSTDWLLGPVTGVGSVHIRNFVFERQCIYASIRGKIASLKQ